MCAVCVDFKDRGVGVLWHGALAAATATAAGHFPWFLTFNFLQEVLPQFDQRWKSLLRSAGIGFTASVVSDSITNSVRVVKTIRQTYYKPIGYKDAAQMVVGEEGVMGLLLRGLKTRLLANGMQGLMFSQECILGVLKKAKMLEILLASVFSMVYDV